VEPDVKEQLLMTYPFQAACRQAPDLGGGGGADGTTSRLPIISADERLAETRTIKGVLLGTTGIGKTWQLKTLDERTTLFVDLEAGDLTVQDWRGDAIRPRTWEQCRDLAVFLGGPNPALRPDQPYSGDHYAAVCERYGDPAVLERYQTLFIDSITVAGRLCLQWCRGQPEAFSERTGRPDPRGAYGLHGREMIAWLSQLQHTRGKNVWFVMILEEKLDDFNRKLFVPQIDGAKTANELPGIVDEVVTLAQIPADEGPPYRAFVCHTLNPWSYPAKDRSGRLAMVEEPHLGRLMARIRGDIPPTSPAT
jgi:hypothetical protein